MRRLTHSLFAKIAAIFLITITLLGTVAAVFGIAAIGALGGYTGEYAYNRDMLIEDILSEYAYDICSFHYRNRGDPLEYYQANNFYFTLSDADGNIIASNYTGQQTAHSVTRDYTLSRQTMEYNDVTGNYEQIEINTANYTITVWEKASMERTDLLSIANFWLDVGYAWRYTVIILAACGFLLFLALLIFLYCSAGHNKETEEIVPNKIDRIPFDLYTAICTALFCIVLAMGFQLLDDAMNSLPFIIVTVGSMILLDFLILLGYTMSLATRLKAGGLIRQMLIYRILSFLWRCLTKLFRCILYLLRGIPLVGKTTMVLLALTVIELIFISLCWWEMDNFLLFWFLEKLILIPLVLFVALLLRKLQKGGENIASGRLNEKIDTRYMFWDLKKFGETLNNINAGMGRAVDEKLKSERLKTELITNVSHDIKTPLTSIINYVDLIKKEDLDHEAFQEYVSVLDRQSSRLKKLIEDLVEASKASTGNLTVQPEPCDIGVLLAQTTGEYQERLEANGLDLVITQPDTPVQIMTDGRHLWRIFENLLSNICKYAQPNTRVYLTLERIGKRAVVTFRNISNYPLNISSDELMERFVRGDASRHTEGSGLGLSIAKSLADLLNGHMDITIDGDLFKVTISFEILES